MERELSQLRQALNFSDFSKFRAQTEYENWLRRSGQCRTWHKMKEIIDKAQAANNKKINSALVLSNMSSPVVHLRCLCPGVDWYLIQEWAEGEKPSWLNKKFPRRCLSGQLIVNNSCYWNNGRIWESGMTDFYVDLLHSMNWQPELVICDMTLHDDADNNEEKQEENQYQIKLNEMRLALSCLKMSGTMVMKLLGVSNAETRSLISSLQTCFKTVELVKLKGSNPLNSEVYMFCHGLHSRQTHPENMRSVDQLCQPLIKKQITEIQKFLYMCGQARSATSQPTTIYQTSFTVSE